MQQPIASRSTNTVRRFGGSRVLAAVCMAELLALMSGCASGDEVLSGASADDSSPVVAQADAGPDCTDTDKIEGRACGSCGAQYRSCSPDPETGKGSWTHWTSCGGEAWNGEQPVCALQSERCNDESAIESRACGRCGSKSRACLRSQSSGDLEWGDWGACAGELPAGQPLPRACAAEPN